MSEENVEIVRRAYELGQSDAEAWIAQYLDPEIEWETLWPGLDHWFHGHDGVRAWVQQVAQPIDIELELVALDDLGEDRVLVELRAQGRGRGSGVPTQMSIFDVYWLRDGRIHRRRTFHSEREARDAAAEDEGPGTQR